MNTQKIDVLDTSTMSCTKKMGVIARKLDFGYPIHHFQKTAKQCQIKKKIAKHNIIICVSIFFFREMTRKTYLQSTLGSFKTLASASKK